MCGVSLTYFVTASFQNNLYSCNDASKQYDKNPKLSLIYMYVNLCLQLIMQNEERVSIAQCSAVHALYISPTVYS